MNAERKPLWQTISTALLLLAVILPMLTFARDTKVFVSASAQENGNGTPARPYGTIAQALAHAGKNTQVHVANGFYKENITIPEDVEIFGESRDGVIITAKSNDKPAVTMSDDTKIDKVTIRNGENGVNVRKDAKVSIIESVIEYSKGDGIRISESDKEEKHRVNITNSIIRKNKRSGVFSRERRVVLMNNEISENGTDGVIFEKNVSAWIDDNNFKDNHGSGLALMLDGADVWMKDNTVRGNDHQGFEISSYGGFGIIDIKKTRIIDNDTAITRIARANFAQNVWNNLKIHSSVETWGNKEYMPAVTTIIKK